MNIFELGQISCGFRIFLLYLFFHCVEAANDEQCLNKTVANTAKKEVVNKYKFYKCPLASFSSENTLCCDAPNYCCRSNKKFYEIEQGLGIIIAVSVVLVALVITASLVICCCWEKCPLYMICRKEAKPDYIAHPEEVTILTPMPTENAAELKTYNPNKASKL